MKDIKYEEGNELYVNKEKENERPVFINTNKKNQPFNTTGNPLPQHELITPFPNKAIGHVNGNPNIKVRSLPDGTYQVHHSPLWGSNSNEFHGFGKDITTLILAAEKRLEKSDKSIEAAKKTKENNSLLGMLKNEYGDNFSTARSTQSKSEYITHDPSGLKIRISDHDLPLHYEQPDIDLRTNQTAKNQFDIVKHNLSSKE